MSDSYSVSSRSDDDGVEIIGDIRIVEPKQGCEDEVRTTRAGSGKAAAGPKYADTYAYLGFYKGEVVEAYFKKTSRGCRVHCSTANWAAIKGRLALDSGLKQLSDSDLVAVIRERTVPLSAEPAPTVAGARARSPETLGSSPGVGAEAWPHEAGAQGGPEAWCQDVRVRTWGADGGDVAAEAPERVGSPSRQDGAVFPRVFHLRLVDITAFIGMGVLIAYISVVFAFLLLWVIY